MNILYSIPIHSCPECVRQLCDGILFFDKTAIIILHVSSSESISTFDYIKNDKILINPTQFETNWGWDFTRIHVSNYLYVKDNIEISHVIFLTSNTLILRNPYEYIKNNDAAFSEHQLNINNKLTPPLLVTKEQIGWGGEFLESQEYLNLLRELKSKDMYGCIIDGCFVNSTIMDKICYFYYKYFKDCDFHHSLEERIIPTIACNVSKKITESSLLLRNQNLNSFKNLIDNNKVVFNKRIERDMENEIRKYYNTIIY